MKKKTRKLVDFQGKKSTELNTEITQLSEFVGKHFEIIIKNMVNDINENIPTMNEKIRKYSNKNFK